MVYVGSILINIILMSLAFGVLGAVFGYKWPGAGWKWGIWTALIPSLVIYLYSILAYGFSIESLAQTVVYSIPHILFACLAADLAARYSLRKMSR